MTQRELQKQLRLLKTQQSSMNPDPSFVVKTKKNMMREISASHGQEASNYSFGEKLCIVGRMLISQKTARLVRVGALMCMVVSTTVAGWTAGVSASSKSMPGDALYSVKLATEKTQIMVASATGDKETETQLHLEAAKRRTAELQHVTKKAPAAKKVVARLKKSVASATETFKELKEHDAEKAKVIAKEVTQKTENISKTLKSVVVDTTSELENVPQTPAEKQEELVLTKEVVEIKHDVDITELSAIATLDSEDAKDVLGDRVEEMLEDAQEVKDVFVAVTEQISTSSTIAISTSTVAVVEEGVDELDLEVSIENSEENPSELSEKDNEVGGDVENTDDSRELSPEAIEEVADQIDESIERVQGIVEEVQQLLEDGSIAEAIEKTKDVQEIAQETDEKVIEVQEKIIEDAQKEQESIEPVVSLIETSEEVVDTSETEIPDGEIDNQEVEPVPAEVAENTASPQIDSVESEETLAAEVDEEQTKETI